MSEQPPGPADASEEPAPRRSALGRVWGLPRGILARYIQFMSRHRFVGCLGCLGTLVVVLALCGVTTSIGRLFTGEQEPLADYREAPVNDIGTLISASEEDVEQYLEGMTEFDAQKMWDAYAEPVRVQMAGQGRSVQELQRGLDQARSQGAKIDGTYGLGSYPLRDGRRYVFYIVRRSGYPPTGAPEELYFVFTVDPEGKILNIV